MQRIVPVGGLLACVRDFTSSAHARVWERRDQVTFMDASSAVADQYGCALAIGDINAGDFSELA